MNLPLLKIFVEEWGIVVEKEEIITSGSIKREELCLLTEPSKQLLEKIVYFFPAVQTFELAEEPNCLACVEAEISAAPNDNEITIGKGIKMGTT